MVRLFLLLCGIDVMYKEEEEEEESSTTATREVLGFSEIFSASRRSS